MGVYTTVKSSVVVGKGGVMLSSLLKVIPISSPTWHGGPEHDKVTPVDNPVESLLLLDRGVTNTLCVCAQPQTQLTRWLKRACVCLELSGHGLLWFGLCGVLLLLHYLTSDYVYLTHTTNMFTLLITDIIIVAPIKVFFKRPRPPVNKGTIPLSVSSVDHYAFPSGHASRCVALAVYFCYMPPFRLQTHLWYIWALVVSVSRVMIGRHHVADVVAGMAAGLFIFETVRQFGLIWELQN